MQWIRNGNTWTMAQMPCVTVEAFGSSGGNLARLRERKAGWSHRGRAGKR